MKKVISLFLSILMLLSMVTGLSFTAQAKEQITKIEVNSVPEPFIGATIKDLCFFSVPEWAEYCGYSSDFKKSMLWFDLDSDTPDIALPMDTVCVEGHTYGVSVRLLAVGNTFASSPEAYLNGGKTLTSTYLGRNPSSSLAVEYRFPPLTKKCINNINASFEFGEFTKGVTVNNNSTRVNDNSVSAVTTGWFHNGKGVQKETTVTYGDWGFLIGLTASDTTYFNESSTVTIAGKQLTPTNIFSNGKVAFFRSADDFFSVECDHNYSSSWSYDSTTHWKQCSVCADNGEQDAHTFDEQFKTETIYDYVMAYDKNENEIAKYTGTSPAGLTYTLNGDYVKLHFHSDNSGNYYGFKITKVVAEKIGCDYTEPDTPHIHSCDEYVSNGNATCTEDGTKTGKCTACNEPVTVTDEGSKLGHDLVETADAVNPTCFSVGWTAGYKCSRCDYEIKQEQIKMLAHQTKTTTIKATTTKDGKIVKACTVCKKTLSTTVIPKASSVTISSSKYTYDGNYKKPTVTVKDSKGNKLSTANYTVTYSNNKYVGKASVKVTFKGNYSGTKTLYFTIEPKATRISSVSAKSKGFTVKWKKQATQTTGYQIQYSTSSKFKKSKTVTVSKNSTTSKTISKLSAKKKYYVRVRTYKTVKINGKATKIYSSWSKAKTVTTKK